MAATDFETLEKIVYDNNFEALKKEIEAGKQGVKVQKVSKDSPAEKAGIKEGDVIIEMGGSKITNLHQIHSILNSL